MKKSTIVLGIAALISAAFLAVPSPVMADCGKMVIVWYVWPSPPPPPPRPVCPDMFRRPIVPNHSFSNQTIDSHLNQIGRDPVGIIINGNGNQINYNKPPVTGVDDGTGTGSWPGTTPDIPSNVNPADPGSVDNMSESDYAKWATGSVPPAGSNRTGFNLGPDNAFSEPDQQAVLAWNGKEEVLILSTNEKTTLTKGMAMLSVLPLPGKPVSIDRANINSFSIAKGIMNEKLKQQNSTMNMGVVLSKKIGSHNIFIWEIESKNDFQGKVQSYISDHYGGKAAALISSNTLKVIDQYVKEGFRYFAFDLTLVEDEYSTKEAIAYRFESAYAYFPLRISQVGGVGETAVDLIVLTPMGEKKLTFSSRSAIQGDYSGLGHFFAQAPFSSKDLNDIDPSLSKLFGNQTVYGRRITFRSNKIDSFQNDFELIPSK